MLNISEACQRARVPAGDSFVARRIGGPCIAGNFFYQIKTEQALVASLVSHHHLLLYFHHYHDHRQHQQQQQQQHPQHHQLLAGADIHLLGESLFNIIKIINFIIITAI